MTCAARPETSSPRIAIAGAGIIGLSCALELARRGAAITLYDPNTPGRGASWAAAGMIAPAFEAASEPGVHPQLFDLCLESARLWPEFAAHLETESGETVGYAAGPSLAVAASEAMAAHLDGILDTLTKRGLPGQRLDMDAARRIEPALSPDLRGVLQLTTDGHVNNRAVVSVLLALCERHPRIMLERTPAPLQSHDDALDVEGHDFILITAGWQSGELKVTEHGKQFSLANWDSSLDEIDTYGGQMLSVERRDAAQGAVLRDWLAHHVLPEFSARTLAVDTAVALRCARLHVPDRRSERDALIAASAHVHGMTVVTRNIVDFQGTGIPLINPWDR